MIKNKDLKGVFQFDLIDAKFKPSHKKNICPKYIPKNIEQTITMSFISISGTSLNIESKRYIRAISIYEYYLDDACAIIESLRFATYLRISM